MLFRRRRFWSSGSLARLGAAAGYHRRSNMSDLVRRVRGWKMPLALARGDAPGGDDAVRALVAIHYRASGASSCAMRPFAAMVHQSEAGAVPTAHHRAPGGRPLSICEAAPPSRTVTTLVRCLPSLTSRGRYRLGVALRKCRPPRAVVWGVMCRTSARIRDYRLSSFYPSSAPCFRRGFLPCLTAFYITRVRSFFPASHHRCPCAVRAPAF